MSWSHLQCPPALLLRYSEGDESYAVIGQLVTSVCMDRHSAVLYLGPIFETS